VAAPKKPGRFRKALLKREPEIIEGLFSALKSPDPRVSLEATRLALAYLHGKPAEEPLADEPLDVTEVDLDAAERAMEERMARRNGVTATVNGRPKLASSGENDGPSC
jgi:hypothetical protein